MENNMTENLILLIKKIINRETIMYLIFGVATTLVDAVTFFVFNNILRTGYIISTVIAWVFAVLFAYITNRIWVFKSEQSNFSAVMKEVVVFFIARIISLIFTIVWMICTVQLLHLDELLAKLLANIFVVIMNYMFSKLFIFKETNKK
jgi:Predicted membrane protein